MKNLSQQIRDVFEKQQPIEKNYPCTWEQADRSGSWCWLPSAGNLGPWTDGALVGRDNFELPPGRQRGQWKKNMLKNTNSN